MIKAIFLGINKVFIDFYSPLLFALWIFHNPSSSTSQKSITPSLISSTPSPALNNDRSLTKFSSPKKSRNREFQTQKIPFFATKLAPGHSLRARDTLTVPCFNTNYGKNAIAHIRSPILWNAIIAQDKDFADMNYKDLAKKFRSIEIFRELTFKETSVTYGQF